MMKSLSDRMKRYEAASQLVLTPRMPLIVRVDGRAREPGPGDDRASADSCVNLS